MARHSSACFMAAALVAAVATTSVAARHVATTTRTPATRPADLAPAGGPHPLLPRPIDVSGLYLDLSAQAKAPAAAPVGFAPVYTAGDWDAYRTKFGADVDDLIRKKSSSYVELAGKMLAAAEEAPAKSGLRRLLCLRATAISFRLPNSWTHTSKALAVYQEAMDIGSPTQVAGLWTMADTLAKYSTTPRPERIKCSALAAKANMQLSLQLLELGQIEAAQALIKRVGYHEGYLRSDAHLKAQIGQTRALVNSTVTMMEDLRGQYYAVVRRGDESAAMRLYLFARFVRSTPEVVRELDARQSAPAIQNLGATITAAERDPVAAYTAGETLRNVASELPEGVIRQRTLYAALHYYRVFMRAPQTENERVRRTLAQMAIQAVASDGARGAPVIRPFEPPPVATHPATAPAPAAAPTARTRPIPSTPALPPVVHPPVHAEPMDGTPEHPVG